MRDIIDYEKIVDRINGRILAETILGPEYQRTALAAYARWENDRTNLTLLQQWIEMAAKADSSREIVRVLKIILGDE